MATAFASLTSTRLVLRRFRTSDASTLRAYRSDPAVARYQGWGSFSEADARDFVARQLDQTPGALGSGAQIAIELASTGEMIGDVYLSTPADTPIEARVGYTLAPAHQGHGYATEAVNTLLGYVFETLGKRRVTALTFADNTRSVALLERVGMRREAHHVRSSMLEGTWVDDYVYALMDDEWRERMRAPSRHDNPAP